jgi:hypothetical protein
MQTRASAVVDDCFARPDVAELTIEMATRRSRRSGAPGALQGRSGIARVVRMCADACAAAFVRTQQRLRVAAAPRSWLLSTKSSHVYERRVVAPFGEEGKCAKLRPRRLVCLNGE